MKQIKKLTALLLAACIIVSSFLPNLALNTNAAAGDTIYVLAGGDFQESGDHAKSAENVNNILSQISTEYTTMDGFLFIGDYDCETHNDATETANGITALMGAVQGAYPNLSDDNSILVQGNHDYMDSRIDATGGHDFDGYSVFVLNEDDYPDAGGTESGVRALATKLETWLNNKIAEGYDAPIFITSHLPLAFGPRTNNKGDGKYAKYLFDVLNSAANNGLNLIFMHGHDHAYGTDNYLGGEAIYLQKGDKINIAQVGSQTSWTEETLNFTYMNAGYVGYYNESGYTPSDKDDSKLTMTVFAITDSEVKVERYSAVGLYNLKSAGRDGYYGSDSSSASNLGLAYNTTVYTSPQTILLTTVSEEDEVGTINKWVEVQGELTEDVTTSGGSWVILKEPVKETTTYLYKQVDTITARQQYVIVANGYDIAFMNNNNSFGSQNVDILTENNETIMKSTVELTEWTFSGSAGGTIYDGSRYLRYNNRFSLNRTSSNLTFSDQGSTFQIYGGNKYYFYYNGFSWTTSSRNRVQQIRLFEYSTVSIEESSDGLYGKLDGSFSYDVMFGASEVDALAAVMAGIDGYYYEAMSTPDSSIAGTVVDDSVLTWTLDPNYDGNTPGDYAVTISYVDTVLGIDKVLGTAKVVVPATSSYYIAEGDGLYQVDMNTSEEDAMAAVKAGVTVSRADDTNGMNKTAIEDSKVTWNWVDSYDGTDNGPYTVEVLYNGTSLGTVEVKVNVKYESGLENWTHVGQSEATGGEHTYVLDTDGIDYGEANKYIIVARNEALALNATSTSGSMAESITISGSQATTTTRDYEYYFVSDLGITKDGIKALYQSIWLVRYDTATSHADSLLNGFTNLGNGYYRIYDTDGTNRSLFYINGTYQSATDAFTVTNSNHTNSQYSVRLYKYTGTTGETPAGDLYAKLEGNTTYTVTQGSSATKALNTVKASITGYLSNNAEGLNATELADSDLTWKWLNTYKGQTIGSYWVEISYNNEVLGVVEVKVEPGVINNYPEYPDEGAVKVDKTVTGIDFQSSGIAQVELSASGVSVKKGADVILMLDTSSSMTSHTVTGSSDTRAAVLGASLEDLIAQFKTPGDDGELLDIRVAIADFNGFYGENQSASGTAYDRDAADMMSDDISYNAASEAQVYTGDGTLGAGAFIDAADLKDSYTLNYTSGTNYDYAMDAIYQLGTAIKESNGEEDRDLYVIFMSDGAAMQWNYYHSQGGSSLWNSWITGAWNTNDLTTANLNCTTHAYYYNEVDTDGDGMRNEHRMANAIKGSSDELYEVIRKTNDLGTATEEKNMYLVSGLDATMFAISFDAQADTNVKEESMDKSIETLASEQTDTTQYYYKVTSADELSQAFNVIGEEIAYAATNARFVDKLGDAYNLQLATSTYTVVENGVEIVKKLTPIIEVLTYDIYTKQDYLNGAITADKVGDRKGTYTLQEVVKFSDDGTQVYSNMIDVDKDGEYGVTVNSDGTYSIHDTDDNILEEDGLIYARTFAYNKGVSAVWIDVDGDAATGTNGKEYRLDSETFYWKMGTIVTAEMALRYYVYLEGSREGTTAAGSYATNEYATLYYDNYLGNECVKDTVSPTVAWESANVSFAFYLVNEDGEIIVNQTTGMTGSFANKIAITNPVVYKEILLNNTDQVAALNVAAISDDVLPHYYELYDMGAKYQVTINSDSTGSWEITNGGVEVNSTYVTQYKIDDATAHSNELINDTVGDDYTHTIVWFAVVWKIQAHPDSVVIDYGLPVDISVLANDMFGEYGKLAAVGPYTNGIEDTATGVGLVSGFGSTYASAYGNAIVDTATGKVRYELNKSNGMQMQTYDKFAYAVNYSGSENAGYYYDTVTVIPATSVYYEDDYVTLESFTWQNGWTEKETSLWTTAGETIDGVQDEDRPGKYIITDANNIYGYDNSNLNMSQYSMGSAKKATVDYDNMARASFEFYGTGFDVISMTNSDTGVIYVDVYNMSGDAVKQVIVDTYYGYKQNADGEWIVDTESKDALYQIPVIKIDNLTYGKYKAVIRAIWEPIYDHVEESTNYEFYLDAIRIYDPTNAGMADGVEDTTIEDAYKEDGEGWPSYMELRDWIIEADSFDEIANDALPDELDMEGLVFIDGDESVGNAQMTDYENYGPKNEIYIAPGQRVAFILDTPDSLASVQIGIKSADGTTGTYTITNIAKETSGDVEKGTYYGARTRTINTTTDMYYDLTGWKNDIIVISNTGNRYNTTGVISVTNIKSTYTSNPYALGETGEEVTYMYMTRAAAMLTLRTLNAPTEEVLPEENIPEISTPTENLPVPEGNVSKPEVSTPEAGSQETTVSDDTATVVDGMENAKKEDSLEEVKPNESKENDTIDSQVEKEELEDVVEATEKEEVEKNIIQMIIDFIKALFEWLFGWFLG